MIEYLNRKKCRVYTYEYSWNLFLVFSRKLFILIRNHNEVGMAAVASSLFPLTFYLAYSAGGIVMYQETRDRVASKNGCQMHLVVF